MAYKAKAYTLREESTESGIRYFISFKDGQGEHHELEVSEQLFFEFRQMERRNRNLLQWDERHREFSEVWDETLNRRALKPKNCTVCGVEYVPSSGISKYCPACAKRIQREKSNESKRRSRERNRRACIELSAKNDRLN